MEADQDFQLELHRLRKENSSLSEELTQCQVDKEFVWSLWKKLQAASPNVTEAVAMVLEREKEKSEVKDRKVLEILRLKDEKIEDQQVVLGEQARDLSLAMQRKMELQDTLAILEQERSAFEDRYRRLEKDYKSFREDSDEMHLTIRSLQAQLDQASDEIAELEKTNSSLALQKDQVVQDVSRMDRENQGLNEELCQLRDSAKAAKAERDSLEAKLSKLEHDLKKTAKDRHHQAKELDNCRMELKAVWDRHKQCEGSSEQQERIISQMKSLQEDTERILKNSENVYERETSSLQKLYTALNHEYTALKQQQLDLHEQLDSQAQELRDKDIEIEELRKQLSTENIIFDEENKYDALNTDVKLKVRDMLDEIRLLRERILEKNRLIKRLESGSLTTPDKPKGSHKRSKSESTYKKLKLLVPESESHKKLAVCQRKLEDLSRTIDLKDAQMETLRQAHSRRLSRLKDLLTSYRLVREQLKVTEEELQGHRPKSKYPLNRLINGRRKKGKNEEETEQMLKELEFLQQENKNLAVKKMRLEEEVDGLRVQSADDGVLIHELKVRCSQEKEEKDYLEELRQAARPTTPTKILREDVERLQAKLHASERVLEEQKKTIIDANRDLQLLVEDNRSLRFENNTLRKEAAARKIEVVDLKAKALHLHKILQQKKTSFKPMRGHGLPVHSREIPPRYQGRRNTDDFRRYEEDDEDSRQGDFNEFSSPTQDEEWEDVEDEETEESLGHMIAMHADGPPPHHTSIPSPRLSPPPMRHASPTHPHPRRLRAPVRRRVFQGQMEPEPTDFTTGDSMGAAESADSEVEYHDRATSPFIFMRDHRSDAGRFGQRPVTHVTGLRQRLLTLQRQVQTLKESKAGYQKKVDDLSNQITQLESDCSSSNQKLRNAKVVNQKLQVEITALMKNKQEQEETISRMEQQTVAPKVAALDREKKHLETRLKTSAEELSRQLSAVKAAQTDLEASREANRTLQDKLQRLERDNLQKKTLLEDLRLKLSLAKDNFKTDMASLEDKNAQLQKLRVAEEKWRVKNDSLKAQLTALSKERDQHQQNTAALQQELDKKGRQLAAKQSKVSELSGSLRELEKTAKEQLLGLAAQGEQAVDTAQHRLSAAHTVILQFQNFIKSFSSILLREVACVQQVQSAHRRAIATQKRQERHTGHGDSGDGALVRAKNEARRILNLSTADLDDLMKSDDSEDELSGSETENSIVAGANSFLRKRDRILKKDDFAKNLTDLFGGKLQQLITIEK